MEDGLFHTPVTDVQDTGDRILQWGSILDRKRNKLRNYFPSPTSAYAGAEPYTDTNMKSTDGNKPLINQGKHVSQNRHPQLPHP